MRPSCLASQRRGFCPDLPAQKRRSRDGSRLRRRTPSGVDAIRGPPLPAL